MGSCPPYIPGLVSTASLERISDPRERNGISGEAWPIGSQSYYSRIWKRTPERTPEREMHKPKNQINREPESSI